MTTLDKSLYLTSHRTLLDSHCQPVIVDGQPQVMRDVQYRFSFALAGVKQ